MPKRGRYKFGSMDSSTMTYQRWKVRAYTSLKLKTTGKEMSSKLTFLSTNLILSFLDEPNTLWWMVT